MKTSLGINGLTGDRSAPTVINTAYGKTMFWDGRAPSLEGQAQGPIQNSDRDGKTSYKEIIERLAKIPAYSEQFEKGLWLSVTLDGMAKAIATFERVAALSGNSPYDKYNAGDNKALSDSRETRPGLVRVDAQHRRRIQDRCRAAESQVHSLPPGLQLHGRAISQPRHRLRHEDRQIRRPGPLGDRPDRRQETTPRSARSRLRPFAKSPRQGRICTTAA